MKKGRFFYTHIPAAYQRMEDLDREGIKFETYYNAEKAAPCLVFYTKIDRDLAAAKIYG